MKFKSPLLSVSDKNGRSTERTGLVVGDRDYESCHMKGSQDALIDTNDGDGLNDVVGGSVESRGRRSFLGFLRRRQGGQNDKKGSGIHESDRRALGKDGSRNFYPTNVQHQRRKFASDIFTTLLELKWRWIFVSSFLTYFGSWLFFAGFWYLIVLVHGDFDHINDPAWTPCVTGVVTFASVFLFSVETQHTIGYGFYHVTEQCAAGVLLLCIQSIVGVILEGLVVGLVFLKISRAKKRSETLMFSREAVICHRDGKKFFMFRVADTRTSHLLEAHVRAQFVQKRVTLEGEVITHTQQEMKVGGDGEKEDKILLFWPTTIVHEIDEESPLSSVAPTDLHLGNNTFEIIVVLEGVLETTGLMTQARSSYAPHEIRWGCRFREIVFSKSNSGQRMIDFSSFDKTFQEESPIVSD